MALLLIVTLCFSAAFTFALLKARRAVNTVEVEIDKSYYFLYSDDGMGVAAASASVSLSGGAGYIYNYGGKEYVVLAAYEDEASAAAVADKLTDVGVLSLYVGAVKSDKSLADNLRSYVGVLCSSASALYACANAYDGGKLNHARLTLALSAVEEALLGISDDEPLSSSEFFSPISVAVGQALEVMQSALASSYPSSDVRYAQVALCAAVLSYA